VRSITVSIEMASLASEDSFLSGRGDRGESVAPDPFPTFGGLFFWNSFWIFFPAAFMQIFRT
jgi:hypothetical protein